MKTLLLIFILSCCVTASAQTGSCPEIDISGATAIAVPGDATGLDALFGKHLAPENLEYTWTVSAEKIIEGQGTRQVLVQTPMPREDGEIVITVSVKVSGLPSGCADTVTTTETVTTGILDFFESFPVDQFGKRPKNDLRARFDNFLILRGNMPGSQGIVEVQINSKESRKDKLSYLRSLYEAAIYRKKTAGWVTFFISEGDLETITALWLTGQDGDVSLFRSEGAVIIKGDELLQKLKTLFLKK